MYDRWLDIPCYLFLVGILHFALVLLSAVVALAGIPLWGWRHYVATTRRVAAFSLILWVVGCVGNSLFMVLAYERLYVSADTLVDFIPFIPFGQWVLDHQFGQLEGRLLNGAYLWHLQALWACVSALVWVTAIAVHRRLWPKLSDVLQR